MRENNDGKRGKRTTNEMQVLRKRRVGHRTSSNAHQDGGGRVSAGRRVREELGGTGELPQPVAEMRAQQAERARAPQWKFIDQGDTGITAIAA
jgi:hypothetical protein